MERGITPASGERAAMGGYLPQFDEFAWYVYLNLINNTLEWIKVADPNAEKLDDIQYSTFSEIHAYQVKWTITNTKISFNNFSEQIALITSSWKNLKKANPSKKIIPHLITNKPASSHDNLKSQGFIIGSFQDFILEVWRKIKLYQIVDDKWNPIVAELKMISNLEDSEFTEFINCFDFQPGYQKKEFSVKNSRYSKEDEDLQEISRFILEKVSNPDRIVELNRYQIIEELGWTDRFKTVFNHELIVDRQRYQPIQSTIELLNSKLIEHKNGYLFLQGGPGSGKSTLLNQWSKGLSQRVIRYYAFDFVNPSSSLNCSERGNATNFLFDLVFQLKEAGIYERDILPYKDLLFLKKVFDEQLRAIGQDYVKTGQSTILIIDGLDHVPRQYITANSFLRELPLPDSLPGGVYIILGSQSYELEDIQQEIQSEFQKGNRTILIDSLKKEEVYRFIDSLEFTKELSDPQKLQIYEKSQGHPLYLSYLIERINQAESIEDVMESFDKINGNIENYYKKIWKPIQKEEDLVDLLGLIARIKGSINLPFVEEWGFDRSVLKSFKEKARILFNRSGNSLSFFHNSFKQFLLYFTAWNYLTDEYDSDVNIEFHTRLAEYYRNSEVEQSWKQNFHLFQAKKYDLFVSEVTPDSFTTQLLSFRPAEEIKQDAKLGIEIALMTKNPSTLIKYLFSLAETERRLFNIDPTLFTEEFLKLNNFTLARDHLRTDNTLHCKESYAFKASRMFLIYGFKSEGKILFNLAYPEIIKESGIYIDDPYRYDEISNSLEEWIYTSPYFETTDSILSKVDNIHFSDKAQENRFEEKEADLNLRLVTKLGYSLIDQNKWDDLTQVIEKLVPTTSKVRNSLFHIISYAIEQCLKIKDNSRANEYLSLLTTHFTIEKTIPIGKIFIADLIYEVTNNVEEVYRWIKDIKQPSNIGDDEFVFQNSFKAFVPLIKLNKLLHICNKGLPINLAIPSAKKGADEEVLVEYERMLCLTTQIWVDGILQKPITINITKKVIPIVKFYYKEMVNHNKYWFKLTQLKEQYFDFLITSLSVLDSIHLECLGDYLFDEFHKHPEYWNTSIQHKIIESLLNNGFDSSKAIIELKRLEDFMLDNQDIDGRITECLTHAKVWLFLNKLQEGEKWLKQAVQESIGVGYRKDYQFSTWIEWLRKINLKDSLKASERIKWFLSHLKHIKETTEGKAYWSASTELLEATFEHNLHDGLEQTIWQFEHDLIDFRDSITLFLKYYVIRVKSEEEFISIIQLYNGLYLLLAESVNRSLLKSILEKGFEILQESFLKEHVPAIISAINIRAYEENRHYLLSDIESFFSSKGVKIENYYPDFIIPAMNEKGNSSTSPNKLTLMDNNEKIDESEVLERVVTFDDFKNIIQEEDQANSYFKWSKVIDKIAPSLSSDQIKEISYLADIEKRESVFYAKLSEAAFGIGDHALAESLANKSIELSSASGWVKFYDGGTRINAFKALQRVNPTLSYNKAFDVFAQDIISGVYTSSYIEYLDEIVPLLSENYNEEALWLEIFGYLQRLMSNSKPSNDLPSLLSLNKPILEILVEYIIFLTMNPIPFIKEQSILLLAKYIDQNNDYALTQLLKGVIDDYSSMDVIMALSELKSPKVRNVKSIAQKLALSKDYILRENSKRILNELGEEIPVSKKIILPPAVYSLFLPEIKKLEINKEMDPYFPEIDINNPRDLIRPFEAFFRLLSKKTGINESNLIHRAFIIMKEIGQEEEWAVDYDKNLRNHLEETCLKYPYTRPRVIACRKAINYIISELVDSGTVDGQIIQNLFLSHDYAVQLFNEKAKPEFIQIIKEKDFRVENDWLDKINESLKINEHILDYGNNFKIIAEYSQVKNLDWGSPTEEYMSHITPTETIDQKEHFIFGSVFHQLSNHYHELDSIDDSFVVIRDHWFDQFDLKSRWIAINPDLARYLGWEPETTKLFSWKNSQGELIAESIYWSNGNILMTPRKDGEVGEGWFVIVSKEGLAQIKSIKRNLFLQKKLIRFINNKLASVSNCLNLNDCVK